MAPMARTSPPFMSTEPEPTSCSPTRVSGLWASWATTVSRWPSSSARREPVPRRRATRSGAWPGEEHGTRSISAASGASATHTDAHSSAPWRSPDGEETATSASSSRGARRAISSAERATHSSMAATLPGYRLWAMPELPEMEIVARRLGDALAGETIESLVAPGINALKAFDPPLSALDSAEIAGVRRRGKLLMLDAGGFTLLMHLMSAGRLQLFDKRASMRDRTMRVGLRLPGDRELRLREFGTRQRAWVKLLRPEALAEEESLAHLGPEAWPDPPDLRERVAAPRPLHSLLRDQSVVTGIGRTWVDEILHTARLSPFKRGDDLSDEEAEALREAMVSELGRVLDVYEEQVAMPLPEKSPKPPRVHNHQGEPCPRCEGVLEAVFYEDYVMTYCPACQTEGRVLKDRRLSRLLK